MENINFLIALVAACFTGFLGSIVFFHDRQSATNKIFVVHAVVGVLWSLATYFSIIAQPDKAIFWIRAVIFLAVPHVFLFFLFVENFPEKTIIIKPRLFRLTLMLTYLMMGLVLTPFVFKGVIAIQGGVAPVPGPLIVVFSPILVFFFIWTAVMVVKKYFQSTGLIKRQWLSIGAGLFLAYTLLIILVFLQVIIFKNTTFVPYSPLFILPIFFGAAYAILRHQLFNVKVIATEVFSFLLLMASFILVFVSNTIFGQILSLAVTVFLLVFSVLLIKSVIKEVQQREQLQILTEKLEAANKQLKILDKARAEFITMASHQLRTPPSSIKWHLSALLAGDFGEISPEVKTIITKANLTNNALISLIEDMLNVSRIERGKMQFAFEPTDMQEITQMTVDQLAPMAEFKKIKLVFNKPKTILPAINADKEKVRQVINNLIDNAIKYTKEGQVTVNLNKTDTDIVLKVTDTGKGVAKGEIGKIFEKFSRGKDSQNYSAGLGLGLYLAQIVINQHQGKIWVESPGVNKGSTFAFSLPVKNHLKSDSLTLDLTKNQNNHKE